MQTNLCGASSRHTLPFLAGRSVRQRNSRLARRAD